MSRSESSFENLSTILAVAAILAIVSMAGELTKHYSASYQFIPRQQQVIGYTRPGQHQPGHKSIQATNHQLLIKDLPEKDNAKLVQRFEQAISLLHAKQYQYAITALEQVIDIVPNMPEAYVNLGYAYLGLELYPTAKSAFEKAIDLRVSQANAYYGLASALDGEKDYEAALGSMRTFIHLSDPNDPFLPKARSAIWEWEAMLGRIPGVAEAPAGTRPQITRTYAPHAGSKTPAK
jgi:tetratricopeptide (TPR) repeat protein